MPTETKGPSGDSLSDLVEKLNQWDGTLEGAHDLRTALRSATLPRRRATNSAEKALLKARSGYADRSGVGSPNRLTEDAELGRALGPFLGDPDLCEWPFHAPLTITDDDALAWLPVVGAFAVPDVAARAFIDTFFRTRRRVTWVPASRALAALATRDPISRDALKRAFTTAFPGGLPDTWPQGRLVAHGKPGEATASAHDARHALHAAASLLALQPVATDFPGFTVERFAGLPLPTADTADASAVLLALRELLNSESTRSLVLPCLAARARETIADHQQEDVLRRMLMLRPPHPELARALAVELSKPRWKQLRGFARLDGLLSWLETARVLQAEASASDLLAGMRKDADQAAPALSLVLDHQLPDSASSALDAVFPRIRDVLDRSRRRLLSPATLSERIVELLLLSATEDLKASSWENMVSAALGESWLPRARGATARAVRVEVVLSLAEDDAASVQLLRDEVLDVESVLSLASSKSGAVAKQVSVQMERLLRDAVGPGDPQLRLLWRLFQADPPSTALASLQNDLRGTGTPLHEFAECLERLAEARAALTKGGSALVAMARWEKAIQIFEETALAANRVNERLGQPLPPLGPLSAVLRALLELWRLPGEGMAKVAWVDELRRLLVTDPALGNLMTWLGSSASQLGARWRALEDAFARARDTSPATLPGVSEAMADLQAALRPLGWPVREILVSPLAILGEWATEQEEERRRLNALAESRPAILGSIPLGAGATPEGDPAKGSPELEIAVGSVLAGRLLVIRQIGAGGFGAVYEVEHQMTKHRRALKVLHPKFQENAEVVERFFREASAAGRIGSANIVETFDAGTLESGAPWILMELLDGEPLSNRLRNEGRLSVELACSILLEVATAVQSAHDAGIVHRDLKPDNLFLVRRNGGVVPKVLDFGISKFTAAAPEARTKTRAGLIIGTPLYMAPEQMLGSQVDARADVFSLGVILYEALAGGCPYTGSTFEALLVEKHNGTVRPLNDVRPEVPGPLAMVIETAMAVSPAARLSSASLFAEAIRGFATQARVERRDGESEVVPQSVEGPTMQSDEGDGSVETKPSLPKAYRK